VRVLVFADSLAFHGPSQPELLTEPRLYPNVLAGLLGAKVDVVARLGMTARDAWWALTKDPAVYSVLLPRADAVVLAVGATDQLPASLPTYLRDGIAYLRPRRVRRLARAAYHRSHPVLVRVLGGRLRVLPQSATDAYLTRCVEGIRFYRPGLPIVGMIPPPYDAAAHGRVNRPHRDAVRAARAWSDQTGVPMVDADAIVAPYLTRRELNPDGMHWSWPVHAAIGKAFADALSSAST
jgi:hypothetical protein